MTIREMRRQSFLRIMDEFLNAPFAVILVVLGKLVALVFGVFVTRELLVSDSIWDCVFALWYAVLGQDRPT